MEKTLTKSAHVHIHIHVHVPVSVCVCLQFNIRGFIMQYLIVCIIFLKTFISTINNHAYSILITSDIISSRHFFPFNIMSHGHFLLLTLFPFDIFYHSTFFTIRHCVLIGIMSQLAFLTFNIIYIRRLVPFDNLSFRRLLPFNILSFGILSHSTFCRSKFFTFGVFFTLTFLPYSEKGLG